MAASVARARRWTAGRGRPVAGRGRRPRAGPPPRAARRRRRRRSRAERQQTAQRVVVRGRDQPAGPVAVAGLPGVGRRAGEQPGPLVRVRGECGGAFREGAGQGVFAGPARLGRGRSQLRREPSAGAERGGAPVPEPAGCLTRAAQDPAQQLVGLAPVRRGGGLVCGDPGPRVAEDDPAGRGVRELRGLGGVQGPGVEPGRGDRPQEGVGGDRVLVGGGEQEQQPGVVGQGADLPAVGPQSCGTREAGSAGSGSRPVS